MTNGIASEYHHETTNNLNKDLIANEKEFHRHEMYSPPNCHQTNASSSINNVGLNGRDEAANASADSINGHAQRAFPQNGVSNYQTPEVPCNSTSPKASKALAGSQGELAA